MVLCIDSQEVFILRFSRARIIEKKNVSNGCAYTRRMHDMNATNINSIIIDNCWRWKCFYADGCECSSTMSFNITFCGYFHTHFSLYLRSLFLILDKHWMFFQSHRTMWHKINFDNGTHLHCCLKKTAVAQWYVTLIANKVQKNRQLQRKKIRIHDMRWWFALDSWLIRILSLFEFFQIFITLIYRKPNNEFDFIFIVNWNQHLTTNWKWHTHKSIIALTKLLLLQLFVIHFHCVSLHGNIFMWSRNARVSKSVNYKRFN